MWKITVGFGVALTVLGAWAYHVTDRQSITALIPAFFGMAFVILGQFARDDKFRKHAMHFAAMLGLIGLAVPAFMVYRAMQREGFEWGVRPIAQALMAVICGVFVVLCVKSFIDARLARKQAAATPSGSPPK